MPEKSKRAADLSLAELSEAFGQATHQAREQALNAGLPVTGVDEKGRLAQLRRAPNGTETTTLL